MAEDPVDRIFICYGREDGEAAARIYRQLMANGYQAWLDRECLVPGQRWKPAVIQAIRGSQYFLALLSSRSVNRKGFLNREIQEALDILAEVPESQSFLIPIRLDDCTPSHRQLTELHRVDMFPSWDEGMRQIKKALDITGLDRARTIDWSRQTVFVMVKARGSVGLMEEGLKAVPHVRSVHLLYGPSDFLVIVEGPINEVSDSVKTIAGMHFVGSISAHLAAESPVVFATGQAKDLR